MSSRKSSPVTRCIAGFALASVPGLAGTVPAAGQRAAHVWCTSQPVPYRLKVTSAGIGPIRVRLSRRELAESCPTIREDTVTGPEAIPVTVTVVSLGGDEVGWVDWTPDQQQLNRFVVTNPDIETAGGLRIGSSVAEVRRVLGTLEAGVDEAGVYVWSPRHRRLRFLIDVSGPDLGVSTDAPLPIARVPDAAVVTHIIFRSN